MQQSIEKLIIHFFAQEQNFGILCKIEEISFNPELPKEINGEFRPLTLFFLAGYTFETARIENEMLIFEAGFGSENFGSHVTIPLYAIFQIVIEESILFLNPTATVEKYFEKKEIEEDQVSRSMNAFTMNEKNKDLLS